MELDGKLTISRPQGGGEAQYISITLTDADAGVRFVEARVPLDVFAEALTGLGGAPVGLIVRGLDLVGTLREIKTEVVPVLGGGNVRPGDAREAIAPFEVDGWNGYDPDYGNPHRRVGNAYRVSFTRNVPRP